MNNIKALYFDRNDVSEDIDINKTSASKECDICHYWYFLNKRFKFQPYVSNRYHDLLMMSMNLSDIAILKIKNTYYHCVISGISKIEAINLMQNIGSIEKSGTSEKKQIETYKWKNMKIFESINKNGKNNYKIWWYWNQKPAIKEIKYKRPISIKIVDINKIVVSNKVTFGKEGFKYFLGYKDAEKLYLYVYFSQKWVHIEETLIKINMYLF